MYQEEYQFYKDAFTTIITGKTIDDARINLYNTDMRTAEPIKLRKSYNLLTGIKIPPAEPEAKPQPKQSAVQAQLKALYTEIDSLRSQVSHLADQVRSLKPGGSS